MGGEMQSDGDLIFRGGNKNLAGGPGNDIVLGGNGVDNIVGAGGNDFLAQGGEKGNVLSGGAGNDVILVSGSTALEDKVTCGTGFDRVLADRKDLVAPDCERVVIGLGVFALFEFLGTIPQSFYEGLPPGVF